MAYLVNVLFLESIRGGYGSENPARWQRRACVAPRIGFDQWHTTPDAARAVRIAPPSKSAKLSWPDGPTKLTDTETLFGSLKVERLHDIRFETRRQAKDEVIDWITFYNRRRMHSTLGYMTPMEFEEIWRSQKAKRTA